MSEYWTDLGQNGYKILQSTELYAFSQDSVLLANLARLNEADSLLDLGSGSGILGFLAAIKKNVRSVVGIELQPELVDMATRSAEANGLNGRLKFICGDIADIKTIVQPSSFDKVICNPPYFTAGSSAPDDGKNPSRRLARVESTASLADFVYAAAYALKNGGAFTVIAKISRLASLFASLVFNGLQPKRLILVYPELSLGADSAIVEAKKGGGEGLTCETLIVKDENGEYTAAFKKIYE